MEQGGAAYEPRQDVLDMMQSVPLIGVVGISGAGKTTLMRHAVHEVPGLFFAISDTSRAPRQDEVDGQDYYFRSREYMERQITARQYATVAPSAMDTLYATAPQEYVRDEQPMLAVLSSAMPSFEQVFPNMRTIAVLPPSFNIWRERLGTRTMTHEQYQRRIVEAKQSLGYILESDNLSYVINDDLGIAMESFVQLIRGKRRSPEYK
jgi:guanylate kinase